MADFIEDRWFGDLVGRESWCLSIDDDGLDIAAIRKLKFLQDKKVFIYTRIPTLDLISLHLLESLGFRVIDTNMSMECPVGELNIPIKKSGSVRLSVPADREAVMSLARQSFAYSRLHLDPEVPTEIADHSRAAWAGNFFSGERGDFMVIAETEGKQTGFLQLLGPSNGKLSIDLIAVDSAWRGRGQADAMIAFGADNCGKTSTLRVGTQVANTPSIRFYERLGFRVVASSYVLHFHGK